MQQQIVLASASARRQELLTQIGVNFRVESQDIDEAIGANESPDDYVSRMAEEKADSALSRLTDQSDSILIIAADTTVVCDCDVMGKPVDQVEAVNMLRRLSGREHRVLSAVTLASTAKRRSAISESRVTFREISLAEAQQYYLSGEPIGKAGSYAIQGYGAGFVEQLIGSYSGVMGLPLFETTQLLNEFGIQSQANSVWN